MTRACRGCKRYGAKHDPWCSNDLSGQIYIRTDGSLVRSSCTYKKSMEASCWTIDGEYVGRIRVDELTPANEAARAKLRALGIESPSVPGRPVSPAGVLARHLASALPEASSERIAEASGLSPSGVRRARLKAGQRRRTGRPPDPTGPTALQALGRQVVNLAAACSVTPAQVIEVARANLTTRAQRAAEDE